MHAGDARIDQAMFDGAVVAFTEDKLVLEHVQTGMATRRTPYLNLGLDKGAMRFRAKVAAATPAQPAA